MIKRFDGNTEKIVLQDFNFPEPKEELYIHDSGEKKIEETEEIIRETLREELLEEIDVELIKKTNYEKGYMDAKEELESWVAESMKEVEFSVDLVEKLKSVNFNDEAAKSLFEITCAILQHTAKKLYLILPADFNQILTNQLLLLVENNYKAGAVEIKIHPSKLEACKNILKLDDWPSYLSDNIVIIEDQKIDENASFIKWRDTALEYNPADVLAEIDNILKNLTQRV